jgi:hypothetical protein
MRPHHRQVWIWAGVLLFFFVIAGRGRPAAAADVARSVDWPQFLSRSDLVWTRMPVSWSEGPFLGNGRLGTIFWESGSSVHFEMGRTDVYDHRNSDYDAMHGRCRLPIGSFSLGYAGAAAGGDLRLDLWNAELRGTIRTSAGTLNVRAFTHAVRNVIVLEVAAAGGETAHTWSFTPKTAATTRKNPPASYVAYPAPTRTTMNGVEVSVQEMPESTTYNTEGRGEGQYATAWKVVTSGAKKTYFISEGFSYPGRTAAAEAVDNVNLAIADGVPALEATHRAWWQAFYPASFLTLPRSRVESFYWIQMYKLAAATRGDAPVMDLMGPWYEETNWPGIWWNLNVQLQYWPAFASNHNDVAASLITYMDRYKANLALNAGAYSSDSYSIGRSTGLDQLRLHDQYTFSMREIGNLGFALNAAWQSYRHTMDDEMLRTKLFPLMKGAFNYLWHNSRKDAAGKIHIDDTLSPEYQSAVIDDCNYTLSTFRWLARTLLDADTRLGTADPLRSRWQDVVNNLIAYPTDADGFRIGSDVAFTNSHRHWSHLFMIYPYFERTYENDATLVGTSVEHWLGLSSAFRGYSWVAGMSFMSMKRDGTRALSYADQFLNTQPQPNTMYREGDPVIETPLYFARGVQDMMLMSHGGVIRVFPGVPGAWSDAAFDRFRAEGAFLVSAKRTAGTTRFVRVESLAGERCRVRTGLSSPISATGSRSFTLTDLGGGVTEVDLLQGEYVILYSGAVPSLDVTPVAITDASNQWGIGGAGSATPTPVPTPTPTPGGAFREITPGAGGVTASTNDGNVPANTVDGSLSTRWSANGDGQWIEYDLGATETLAYVTIAFYSGNARQTRFDVQTSSDGTTWSNTLTGALSSGTSTVEETFDIPDTTARYVRYLGHGNTVNGWNSLTEVSLFAPAGPVTPTPTPTATATPTATPTPTPTTPPTPTPTPGSGFSGYYKLIARHSGKAVVVQSASTADGANVFQWTYGGTATNDEWQLVDLGTGYFRIVNRNSGKVMEVAGASTVNAGNVDQTTWTGATHQQWQVIDLGTGFYRLANRNSGKVLDVSGASTADGANCDQWSWVNVNQEQFQIVSVP